MSNVDPARVQKWLWLATFLFGWQTVTGVIGWLARWLQLFADSLLANLMFVGITSTLLAWVLARFAFRLGAPRGIWIPIALTSAWSGFTLMGVASLTFASGEQPLPGMAWRLGAICLALVGPPLAMFVEGLRAGVRMEPATVAST